MLVGDPNFNRSVLGPFLCPYLYDNFLWDGNIREAVNLWCSDPEAAKSRYGHISKWNVLYMTSMTRLFDKKWTFNEDISRWDVSKVQNMDRMFRKTRALNQPIGGWDVSKVQNMQYMFYSARALNPGGSSIQPLGVPGVLAFACS